MGHGRFGAANSCRWASVVGGGASLHDDRPRAWRGTTSSARASASRAVSGAEGGGRFGEAAGGGRLSGQGPDVRRAQGRGRRPEVSDGRAGVGVRGAGGHRHRLASSL
ncbi:hypothetical protein ACFU53_03565 [Streptomyces sp. NPDC057474]|uniref:hypothetical protein n=1 Tax=Streptomyces sp. NPDC057474 TaxID=3346144 RepID=UPI0036A767BE